LGQVDYTKKEKVCPEQSGVGSARAMQATPSIAKYVILPTTLLTKDSIIMI
jgi:hypothetical protein